ncbi:MAG: type IV pili methyl-accepting chemotaxis transducer N-terminal domain-containing protein [Burkholderiales bacterium]|nr:type IV pili methyl-accepting chemotaxis transducer N-terminal domain-containing protein [Burkholderiales bacterium]
MAQAVAAHLYSAGLRVAGATACCNLVREAVRLAPEMVVVQVDVADEALFTSLGLLQAACAVPVLLFCRQFRAEAAEQAAAGGVTQCFAGPCSVEQVTMALPLSRALFQRHQALQRELAGVHARLDERKWVDRAKGVLMSAQQLSEPDAFALLRTASMQTNLRVGEVSRAVIEAAESADAVNRAGQLRMLSQRIVKARVLEHIGIERALADTLMRDSVVRVQASIDHLAGLGVSPALEALRLATRQAWQALQAQLALQPPADLLAIDAAAAQLLEHAQALTDGLQAASGRPSLQLVNLSGRQRMLAQRVAKHALLASVLPQGQAQAQATDALATVAEFDAALQRLEQAPLASEEIRSTLAVARGQWQRLLEGMRPGLARDGRVVLARESEALLQSFERLTSLYEHNMQVLLG